MDETISITVVGRGIGRSSAVTCMSPGATVIATDTKAETLSALSEKHSDISTQQLKECDRSPAFSENGGVTI